MVPMLAGFPLQLLETVCSYSKMQPTLQKCVPFYYPSLLARFSSLRSAFFLPSAFTLVPVDLFCFPLTDFCLNRTIIYLLLGKMLSP